jgi:hypothetical protein
MIRLTRCRLAESLARRRSIDRDECGLTTASRDQPRANMQPTALGNQAIAPVRRESQQLCKFK